MSTNYMYIKEEINFYQIGDSSSLPEDGWFQNCKCCKRTITGNLKMIRNVETVNGVRVFNIYTCKDCINMLKNNKKKMSEYKSLSNKLIFEYREKGFVSDIFTGVQCFKIADQVNKCCF